MCMQNNSLQCWSVIAMTQDGFWVLAIAILETQNPLKGCLISEQSYTILRPNKKVCVVPVTSEKSQGRQVGIFFYFMFFFTLSL